MSEAVFQYSLEQLKEMNDTIIRLARTQGASAVESEVSLGFGQDISVRLGEVETIEYTSDKGVNVTVYFGQKKGNASSSDLSLKALEDTVTAACNIARYTAEDAFCGLAEAALLATHPLDLDLHHAWPINVDEAVELAQQCESEALEVDERITNSEGASVSTHQSLFAYANSLGFNHGYPSSRHGISCSVIAEQGEQMQRDYWYSTARDAKQLMSPEQVGRLAGERTARRLNAKSLTTRQTPVIFEAPVAAGLISSLVSAISGGNLYRNTSFLKDSLHQQVMSNIVSIHEEPHILAGLASSPFDYEGVLTKPRVLVHQGELQGYMLSSYSARKLAMQTTGNSGGNHNLIVSSQSYDFAGLLQLMGTGLLVTELLGQGVNMVTGDYSRGAAGFWVENGQIQYPVEEITIAGNLATMFKQIVAIGSDTQIHGSKQIGSVLIERMTVAGK
jgi:PmbA protein